MPAKKNIIKSLRQEIAVLEDRIAAQHQHLAYREKQFKRIQNGHEYEMRMINSQTNNIATRLRLNFSKELTWLELTDDGDSQFQIIKGAITDLENIAGPENQGNG